MSNAPIGPDPLDTDLNALKERATLPCENLVARVMADADTVQSAFLAPPVPVRQPFAVRFMALIGGWPSLAGLATASLAGVWIGVSQPDALIEGSQKLLYGDVSLALIDLDPELGFSDLEGGL